MMQSYMEFNTQCVQADQELQNQAQTENIPAAARFFRCSSAQCISKWFFKQQLCPIADPAKTAGILTLPSSR